MKGAATEAKAPNPAVIEGVEILPAAVKRPLTSNLPLTVRRPLSRPNALPILEHS